uniref:HTH_Tnp_Tc3_2 domain-containing protein n=1 Tax=Heterorhabditis bacteriophora TaxID=37862 RepID=A0A1I7XCU2_HETBA
MPKALRTVIIHLHELEDKHIAIAKKLCVTRITVHRTVKRCQELATVEDHPRSGRPRSVKTSRIQKMMASDQTISPTSMRGIVKHELRFYPYKICRAHMLTEKMKVNRYEKSKKLVSIVQQGRAPNVLFTDEKIFTVNSTCVPIQARTIRTPNGTTCNSQNSRQLLQRGHQRSEKASVNSRSHFPSSVMVWTDITASGKTPLVFVEKKVTINTKYYSDEILPKIMAPWASKHFRSQNWTFQQDWAPTHGSKATPNQMYTYRKYLCNT